MKSKNFLYNVLDELNVLLVTDKVEYDHFAAMRTHLGILDKNTPLEVGGYAKLPSPLMSTIQNWLDEEDQIAEGTAEAPTMQTLEGGWDVDPKAK